MSLELENLLLSRLASLAEVVAENPELFQVCEGCECLAAVTARTCPRCNAYRFDRTLERIAEVSHKRALVPLHESFPVLPRLGAPVLSVNPLNN